MLIIDSEEFHGITLEALENQIAQSLRVGPNNRYVPCNYVEEAHASWMKRLLYTAAGHVLRLIWFMF